MHFPLLGDPWVDSCEEHRVVPLLLLLFVDGTVLEQCLDQFIINADSRESTAVEKGRNLVSARVRDDVENRDVAQTPGPGLPVPNIAPQQGHRTSIE